MIRKVKEVEWDADKTINQIKMDLGVIGLSSGGNSKEFELKPPLFSGELSELDYYTFKREFEDYVSVKSLSKNQALRILTRTCLQGPVQSACRDFKSCDDVLDYLKTNYGNPRLYLVGEFRRSGNLESVKVPILRRGTGLLLLEASSYF